MASSTVRGKLKGDTESINGPDQWAQYVTMKEWDVEIANKIYASLSNVRLVMVCDDSNSMRQAIAEEGTDPFAPKKSTRWLELKKLASEIITLGTIVNPQDGVDLHFLNRAGVMACRSASSLQDTFLLAPTGGTPLVSTINNVAAALRSVMDNGQVVLLVVITDGEPAGGPGETRDGLFTCLQRVTANGRLHVSFAECTDMADDMEYLDLWDGKIRNFDNTDDYREELQRVRVAQNDPTFKFDYSDYVNKILMATLDRWFYNLDQQRVGTQTKTSIALAAPSRSTMTAAASVYGARFLLELPRFEFSDRTGTNCRTIRFPTTFISGRMQIKYAVTASIFRFFFFFFFRFVFVFFFFKFYFVTVDYHVRERLNDNATNIIDIVFSIIILSVATHDLAHNYSDALNLHFERTSSSIAAHARSRSFARPVRPASAIWRQ
jgi:hypothetical protein